MKPKRLPSHKRKIDWKFWFEISTYLIGIIAVILLMVLIVLAPIFGDCKIFSIFPIKDVPARCVTEVLNEQ